MQSPREEMVSVALGWMVAAFVVLVHYSLKIDSISPFPICRSRGAFFSVRQLHLATLVRFLSAFGRITG